MDPYSGDVWKLREELVRDMAEVGESIEMEKYRAAVAALGESATSDEVEAMRAKALVRIEESAARKLILGEREQERRRKRKQAEKRARKRNR